MLKLLEICQVIIIRRQSAHADCSDMETAPFYSTIGRRVNKVASRAIVPATSCRVD